MLEFITTYRQLLLNHVPVQFDSEADREDFGTCGGFEMLQLLLPPLFRIATTRFDLRGIVMLFLEKAITLGVCEVQK
jgi:hypothetical protein